METERGESLEVINAAVKSIVIYLILVTVVMNLLGNSTYKKYVGIFTGMVLIILVITPVMTFLKADNKMNHYLDFHYRNEENKSLIHEMDVAKEQQVTEVIEEYKKTVEEEITSIIMQYDFHPVSIQTKIEEDIESNEFGQIRFLEIVLSREETNQEEELLKDKIEIDPVERVDLDNKEKHSSVAKRSIVFLETKDLKQELSRLYHLKPENTTISIQER